MGSVKFYRGTLEEFQRLQSVDPDALYFLSSPEETEEGGNQSDTENQI